MKKLLLIANPNAGKGKAKAALDSVETFFREAGYETMVRLTAGRGDAAVIAREAEADLDLLVCCGGDGTLSEVTSGLAGRQAAPPLGYIPMGTANDVARTLGLSGQPLEAAAGILSGRTIPYDMGRFNDEHFTYVAAFGAFTSVSYATPQKQKARLGHLAYVLGGIRHIPGIRAVDAEVHYDGAYYQGRLLFGGVTNSASMAGMLKFPRKDVDLGDGRFELMLIPRPKGLIGLLHILSNILRKKYDPKYVLFTHCTRACFTFREPVAWTRDGEAGGSHDRVLIENQTNAVQFVVPEDSPCL